MPRSQLFMWRNSGLGAGIFLLACVFLLAGRSALGDVIPISVSQSVSGTENPIVCYGGLTGTCSSNSSGFSISNTTVGPYSVNKSDQATATLTVSDGFPAPITYSVTASVQANQSSNETANSISISMDTTAEISTGQGFLSPVDGGQAQGTNAFTFQFDLSAPSWVELTGSADSFQPESGLSPLVSETVAFSLTGPGFDLDSTSPSSPVYYPCGGAGVCGGIPVNFNDTFSLAPGVYTFTASDDAGDSAAVALSVENMQDLSLQLTLVPEPRWAALILLPLFMTAGWAVRRITTS